MEWERYYIDLLDMLNTLVKKIADGDYDESDVDKLLAFTKKNRFPGLFSDLAESIGMMIVKLEAREFE